MGVGGCLGGGGCVGGGGTSLERGGDADMLAAATCSTTRLNAESGSPAPTPPVARFCPLGAAVGLPVDRCCPLKAEGRLSPLPVCKCPNASSIAGTGGAGGRRPLAASFPGFKTTGRARAAAACSALSRSISRTSRVPLLATRAVAIGGTRAGLGSAELLEPV